MKSAILLLAIVAVAAADSLSASLPAGLGRKLQSSCTPRTGTDWYGGDLHKDPHLGVGSAHKCCDKCKKTHGCIAYIYRLDKDHCWLKNSLNNPSPCDVCSGEYFSEPKPAAKCYAYYGTDRPGGDFKDMPLHTSSPAYCCEKCHSTPGCKAWLWRRDHHHCYLKHTLNPVKSCPACVRGDY